MEFCAMIPAKRLQLKKLWKWWLGDLKINFNENTFRIKSHISTTLNMIKQLVIKTGRN